MLDFFQKCEIIHVDKGIVFAHGGFNIEKKKQFDRDLLSKSKIKDLKIYYDYLLKDALEYVKTKLERIPKPNNESLILEIQAKNRKIALFKNTNKDDLINFYENVIKEISKIDLKYSGNNNKNDQQFYYDLSANLKILVNNPEYKPNDTPTTLPNITHAKPIKIDRLIWNRNQTLSDKQQIARDTNKTVLMSRDEACYYLLLNMSLYPYNSPIMCSGGITENCQNNKVMHEGVIDFYTNNRINTVVVGHKPVCFQLPLVFYDNLYKTKPDELEKLKTEITKLKDKKTEAKETTIKELENEIKTIEKQRDTSKIYTFSGDLTGTRNLYLVDESTKYKSVIPLGIIKKQTVQTVQTKPKFSIEFLREEGVIEKLTTKELSQLTLKFQENENQQTTSDFDLSNINLNAIEAIYSTEIKGE